MTNESLIPIEKLLKMYSLMEELAILADGFPGAQPFIDSMVKYRDAIDGIRKEYEKIKGNPHVV